MVQKGEGGECRFSVLVNHRQKGNVTREKSHKVFAEPVYIYVYIYSSVYVYTVLLRLPIVVIHLT